MKSTFIYYIFPQQTTV